MNYPDSVQFLYSLGNEVKTAKLGLERITALLEALGDPHRKSSFVHVAGTNGKGSTCAMIESGLRAAGVRTGLFTSPHLVEPTERIQIAGVPVAPYGIRTTVRAGAPGFRGAVKHRKIGSSPHLFRDGHRHGVVGICGIRCGYGGPRGRIGRPARRYQCGHATCGRDHADRFRSRVVSR